MMHVELQATCAALGYYEGDVYHKEPDCLGEYTSVSILYSVVRIVNNSFALKAGVNSFMAELLAVAANLVKKKIRKHHFSGTYRFTVNIEQSSTNTFVVWVWLSHNAMSCCHFKHCTLYQ